MLNGAQNGRLKHLLENVYLTKYLIDHRRGKFCLLGQWLVYESVNIIRKRNDNLVVYVWVVAVVFRCESTKEATPSNQ